MAVLCEAISVIVPAHLLEQRYPHGLAGYIEQVPNATFCCDGTLTRVGFMHPADVEVWVDHLIEHGFEFLDEPGTTFIDVAVVDQIHGPTAACDWLATGMAVGARWAWMVGHEPGDLVAPNRWSPGASAAMELVPPEDLHRYTVRATPDVPLMTLVDRDTGAETYVGRAYPRTTDD